MATAIISLVILGLIILAVMYIRKKGACAGCENSKQCSSEKNMGCASCSGCPSADKCMKSLQLEPVKIENKNNNI